MDRICRIADICGDCSLINISYDKQLIKKQLFFENLFIGHKVNNIIGIENPYNYRNKIYATFGYLKNNIVAGIYEENSHK